MEEELVAGESPDKSVDEGTPGTASTSAESDPRLSVFRQRDPETPASADTAVDAEPDPDGSGGRDALRDAVAAWVATADEPAPESDDRPAASASAVRTPATDPADSAQEPDTDSAPASQRPSGDQRTTSFRLSPAAAPEAAEPGSDSASASEQSADEGRTTAFRAAKPAAAASPSADSGSESEQPSGDQGTTSFRLSPAAAPEAAEPGSDSASESEQPSGDQGTTSFRLAEPAAASPSADSGSASEQPAGDQRTTSFRAVKADSAEAGDSERTAVFRAVKPAADAPVKEPAPRERTGVFRIPAADAGDSERTATFRAVKPAVPAPAPADEQPADSPAQAKAKPSTFVPLRTDEPVQPPKASAPAPAPAAPAASAPASTDRTERTTQQPLPPKPPLDMLADLTNNPPPPPSPLRTAVRRFKIYFPLVVLLAIILAVVQLVRPLPEPKLVMTAKSSYTFDGAKPELPWPSEGQAYMAAAGLGTLGQSGEQKPVPIASVTKSMTAYIILRDHPIKKGEQGAMIDIDKTAETEGKKNDSVNNESTLDTVKEGDKISEYDAIAALMIPSANNIARLLARWDSGSQEAFVKKMNDTAKELGMANTTYTDPSGLDATTVSTAEDQVKLGLKLVEIETLLDITKKPSWVDPSGKKWDNWNRLVPYNDSLGIKTGTTTKAGGNLLFAAQKKIGNTNQLIVGAVLGQHKPPIIDSVISASKQLMLATQKALEGAPVVKKGQVVGYVDDGLGGRTPVVATADVQAVGWASLTVNVKLADGGSKIPQTAKSGTEIGVLTVGEGASQVKVPVALQGELAAPGIGSKLTRVG
ncbi:hypothetical protein ACTVZO_18730 [Streptomyces sp. IBSNAI002]|uniref:hypothetical protein n=1 Tax=Streptomyces sp. IBSNAI002 TaxID=3457500 RepID=UPI003FD25183